MKNAKQLFDCLKQETENHSAECKKTIEQLQSISSVIYCKFPYVKEKLLTKAIRKTVELRTLMPNSEYTKELNALQGYYHKLRNNRQRVIEEECSFANEDLGNDCEKYY